MTDTENEASYKLAYCLHLGLLKAHIFRYEIIR